MRFLWIEDCDGGNSTQKSDIKKWKQYFEITEEKRLTTLEDALEFLEIKENWKLFDVVLIDIRFPVCKRGNNSVIDVFHKYFETILNEEKFLTYAQTSEEKKQNASAGVLLYLALVFRYNFPQSKIAFISANIDGTGDQLSPSRTMKELIYKAKAHNILTDDEIAEFETCNEDLCKRFCEKLNVNEDSFDFKTTEEIDWYSEKNNYHIDLILKLRKIEKELTKVLQDEKAGLMYNSVKTEFEKIGLVIPQAFEKPEIAGNLSKSWSFVDWRKSISNDYSIIRTNFIIMCSICLKEIETEKTNIEKFIQPYRSIVDSDTEIDELFWNIKEYLNSIIECLPITYWENSKKSLGQIYSKILRENVVPFGGIISPKCDFPRIKFAQCAVLKTCRNWISHQGIDNIDSKDVVFTFILAMRALFDLELLNDATQQVYYKSEEELVRLFHVENDFNIFENYEELIKEKEIYAKKLKNAFDRFINDPKVSQSKKEKTKGFSEPDSRTSFWKILSGLGHEYSPDRKKVCMADLEKCFIISLYDNNTSKKVEYHNSHEKTVMTAIEKWCYSLIDKGVES